MEGRIMERILNFMVTVVILTLACYFFPDNVWVENFGWLLLTAPLIWIVSDALALLFVPLTYARARAFFDSTPLIAMSLIGIFSGTIAILLLDSWFDGFYVSGFWAAFLLAIIIPVACECVLSLA